MKEQFTKIYQKGGWSKGRGSGVGSSLLYNKKYIQFLENFLKDNDIKSVIDYGCGDWQFSQHINWGDIDYLGLDIVDSVIEKNQIKFPNYSFVSDTDVFKHLDGKELIIIKDVLMHWPNDEIINFLDKLIKIDILIFLVNSAYHKNQPTERKIKIGGWSPLEYDKFPLNKYNTKLIFRYRHRQVVLIK